MLSLIFTGMFVSIIVSSTKFISNFATVIIDDLTSKYDYIISNKDGTPITKSQEDAVLKNVTKVGIFSDSGYIRINDHDYLMNIFGTDTTISYKVGFLSQNNGTGFQLKENEIVVLDSALKDLNLKIGDKLTFYNSKGNQYELTVAKSIRSDQNLLYEKGKNYTFATNLDTFKKITEREELENYGYYISFDKKLSDAKKKEFENKCDEIGIRADNREVSADLSASLSMIIPVIAVIILLMAVIVYFVNNSFVKIILNERVPIMGTFRSVGATSKILNKILILEMALYGFISGVIGSILGYSLTRLFIKSVLVPMLEESFKGFDFSILLKSVDNSVFSILIISILCITIFQIVLSLKDIFASNKRSIKDCIFSKYDDVQIFNEKNIIFGVTFLIIGIITIILKFKLNTFWGIMGLIFLFASIAKLLPYISKFVLTKIKFKNPLYKMAGRNVYNSKLQMGSSIILCILICIIIILISYANSVKKEYISVEDKYSFDSYIGGESTSLSDEDINDISYVEGVKSTATLYEGLPMSNKIYLANNKVSYTFLATDDAKTFIKTNKTYAGVDANTLSKLTKNEIIIPEADAKKYGINIGDYIYLNNIIKRKHFNVELPVYLKVVGLQKSSTGVAFINPDLIKELESLEILNVVKSLYVISEKNVDVTDNINKLLEENGAIYKAKTLSEFLAEKESESTSEYIGVIIACVGLSLIVIICLTNNQKISFLQRKKEFATLNSICMSRKQLKKMITIELMISYLISSLIAVIYSFIISNIASHIMGMQLETKLSSLITIFIIMGIVMYLVSIKIRKNINKINIIDEIKYE